MKGKRLILLVIVLSLTGCAKATLSPKPTVQASMAIPSSPTPRFTMLPTWTPSNNPLPAATRTPRNTSTPLATQASPIITPAASPRELLVDRPTYAQLARPVNLVSMVYDPTQWSLNTAYPTDIMGYALTSRTIYGCKLEPVVEKPTQGFLVEQYKRSLGGTPYQIARAGNEGMLEYATYCTGEGEDRTCYQVSPGDDHVACIAAAEAVLARYKLIANPFFERPDQSPYRWICADATGSVGLCQISYSIPMNALAFAPDGTAWAAGDDGKLMQRVGGTWSEVSSAATYALYDLNFSSASNGWAVGDGAEVLRWNGGQWNEVLPYHGPGEGPGGSTQVLYAVDTFSVNEAWMVGVMKGIDGKNSAYALHWNGKDLLEEGSFPECNCGLNAVLTLGPNNVYVAGGSDLGAIIFHWDGISWSDMPITGADHLYTLAQASDGTLWAGGIEVARDQSDTRGALFHWDGGQWQRVAIPPLTGGIYALGTQPGGQIVLGGDFTAIRVDFEWQPIITDIAGFGWIVDIEPDLQGNIWALTHSGNIFQLGTNR
jgi:hypothetical protein